MVSVKHSFAKLLIIEELAVKEIGCGNELVISFWQLCRH